ncbi:hypothetical protein GSF08_09320 [Clostridiaceae bacterium DONG20-135]|uniref:Uncharacterized protein n=1 Tax=Copranaerobaculum intestinale TaxID=2692629 RepID=A0A6N8UFT3_9FIRM|nr:hypothetical protein [Copranaerobaculum intestinale]MXQ74137.1 hypothetical protein [Copranaerobaculum intestinale]
MLKKSLSIFTIMLVATITTCFAYQQSADVKCGNTMPNNYGVASAYHPVRTTAATRVTSGNLAKEGHKYCARVEDANSAAVQCTTRRNTSAVAQKPLSLTIPHTHSWTYE